jgi:hypothetical protein
VRSFSAVVATVGGYGSEKANNLGIEFVGVRHQPEMLAKSSGPITGQGMAKGLR